MALALPPPIPSLMAPDNCCILNSDSSYACASVYCPPPLPSPSVSASDSFLNFNSPELSVSALTSPLPPIASFLILFWLDLIASSDNTPSSTAELSYVFAVDFLRFPVFLSTTLSSAACPKLGMPVAVSIPSGPLSSLVPEPYVSLPESLSTSSPCLSLALCCL